MKKLIISVLFVLLFEPVFSQLHFKANLHQYSKKVLQVNQSNGFQFKSKVQIVNDIPVSLYSINLQDNFGEETYEVYYQRYKTAKSLTTVGAAITITGFSLFGAALGWLMLEAISENGSVNTDPQVKMMVSSYFFVSVGLPIWISQYQRAKNNKAAMKRVRPAQLSLGVTKNGAGLVVSF